MSSDKLAKLVSYLWPQLRAGISDQGQPVSEAHSDICSGKTLLAVDSWLFSNDQIPGKFIQRGAQYLAFLVAMSESTRLTC